MEKIKKLDFDVLKQPEAHYFTVVLMVFKGNAFLERIELFSLNVFPFISNFYISDHLNDKKLFN